MNSRIHRLRRGALFCLLLLPTSHFPLPTSAAAAPDPLIPAALAPDRYRALSARSPFSPPTAEAPPPVASATPPPPGWGEKYTLGGLAQFGAGYKVTLNPKNPVGAGASASAGGNNVSPTERLIVVSGTPGPDGITLAGVQWSDDPKQTKATLVKSGVAAVFAFDPAALSAAKGSAATAASIPAPRSSTTMPALPVLPNAGFTPPPPPPNFATPPQPGIVRSPGTRAPIRPPPPTNGAYGQPFIPPPPPPTIAPVRAARLPAPAVAVPGNAATDDEDD